MIEADGDFGYSKKMAATQDAPQALGFVPQPKLRVLQLHRDQIRVIARKHRVTNPQVFGSVLTGEDTEKSDLDILVEPTQETTLMDIARLQVELRALLNVTVDVLTPRALPEKFRYKVVGEAMPL